MKIERFKVDEYRIREKGREYAVLVFPFIKYMWAYDNGPEDGGYMVDGPAEVFSMLKYAMAILTEASDKIIYFPCKQSGIGRFYRENYHLVLCTPKAQLRRSSWINIRRKLNNTTKIGKYVLQYNRKKLDDFCDKKLLEVHYQGLKPRVYPKAVIRKKMDKEHFEEVLGETLFMVLGNTECYFNHYHICKDLDEMRSSEKYSSWSAMGWIFTPKVIKDMIEEEKK